MPQSLYHQNSPFYPQGAALLETYRPQASKKEAATSGNNLQSLITADTLTGISHASNMGYDVSVEPVPLDIQLQPDKQAQVTEAIEVLEARHPIRGIIGKNALMDPDIHPIADIWRILSKRAIALTPLYDPKRDTLGQGVNPGVYNERLFNGSSAAGILIRDEGPKDGKKILDRYVRFIETPMYGDGYDQFGLTSADYLAGVPDSIAVRMRAIVAGNAIASYAAELEKNNQNSLNITSLACGAAGPMFKIVPELQKAGVSVGSIQLVDWDVMALATAVSLAETEGISDLVTIKRQDIVRDNLKETLADTDVVDLLGLFEYFPTVGKKIFIKHRAASSILNNVASAMKPGSVVVFGNMLRSRPHQAMFSQVWPQLQQRSVPEVIELTKEAGFNQENISVRVAPDGVYAIYVAKIPDEGVAPLVETKSQSIAKRWVMGRVEKY